MLIQLNMVHFESFLVWKSHMVCLIKKMIKLKSKNRYITYFSLINYLQTDQIELSTTSTINSVEIALISRTTAVNLRSLSFAPIFLFADVAKRLARNVMWMEKDKTVALNSILCLPTVTQ